MRRRELFLFLRAQQSALLASAVDFLLTLFLSWTGLYYVYATVAGALVGGVVNCIVNYHAVFNASSRWPVVAGRYLGVWTGSLLLNVAATLVLTELVTGETWFLAPKFIASVAVALLWNYPLHRYFVFREN